VERILNEPTAAALAYGFDRSSVKRVLVFDLGGGTFDVSILRIAQGVFDVKATSGDTQLGGNDWDRRIVDWLADAFQAEHSIDLRRDRQALQRLTEASEKAKQELSGVLSTPISLPFIATGPDGPLHIETSLERRTFESLCPDLLDRLLRPVQRALRDSGLAADDIDDVVLVRGSIRMPMAFSRATGNKSGPARSPFPSWPASESVLASVPHHSEHCLTRPCLLLTFVYGLHDAICAAHRLPTTDKK
jgi:molecular chaperone DnaK